MHDNCLLTHAFCYISIFTMLICFVLSFTSSFTCSGCEIFIYLDEPLIGGHFIRILCVKEQVCQVFLVVTGETTSTAGLKHGTQGLNQLWPVDKLPRLVRHTVWTQVSKGTHKNTTMREQLHKRVLGQDLLGYYGNKIFL